MEILSALLLFLFVISFLLVFPVILFGNEIKTIYYKIPFVSADKNIKQLALELADIYKRHRNPIIGTNICFNKSALVIRDLELVRCVLAKDFDCFQSRGLFYNEIDDPLSTVLGTLEHADWSCTRKKISPSFKPAKMKSIFLQIKNMCNDLVWNLNQETDINGRCIEIIEVFSRFTIDAIKTITFGKRTDESDERLFRDMILQDKKPFLKYPLNRFPVAFHKLARFLRLRKHSREVTDFIVKYVFEIVKYRTENNVRQDDFIQSWIDENLEIHRIAAVGFDLLSVGYADSTSTLAYCLYELSLNKTIQNKAREEINDILKNEDEFTYAALLKLRYVNQIIKEAERKYPVAGIATRVASQTYVAPNVNITIPSGMKVFIPIYGIHHDDQYYANPETFDPDRFTKESMSERPRYAFLPFGAGPRQCLGSKFAEMIINIGLVKLLQNFEFSACPLTEIPIRFNNDKNTLHPESGVILNVRRVRGLY